MRRNDVWLQYHGDDADIRCRAADRDWPKLERSSEQSDEVTVELPEYALRRRVLCQDALASVDAFRVLCYIVLARLLGIRMCARCPACNADDSENPCQNNFGSNMRPLGGFLGGCEGLGGAIESQRGDTLHLHFKAIVISALQHHNLEEIAEMIRQALLSPDAVKKYHDWAMREEHMNPEQHKATLEHLEKAWLTNFRAPEHDALSVLPSHIINDTAESM